MQAQSRICASCVSNMVTDNS